MIWRARSFELPLRRGAIRGGGELERLLQDHAPVRGDGANGRLDLHLEFAPCHLGIVNRRSSQVDLDLGARDLGLGVLDGALERRGVGLLERGAVAQAGRPIHRALGERLVAIVKRVDAQAKHLEGAG